ncbi:MAG: hypothetical protein IKN12_09135 [Selenomonadaceae bacterium]|nr:hypothetical protein [Selenomonadaceae bacterium]
MRDRKTLINHIRAAVDWLKEADNSLSNKDDVSGDLKLMLAEAELQRAKERVPLSKRTKRIINFAAVALGVALAIGTWYMFKDSTAEKAKTVEVHETINTATDKEKQEEQPKEETLPETKASEHEQNPVAEEKISESNERAKNPAPQKEEPKQTQEAKPLDRESPPSDEMQKLMESAGKVLRK